MHPKRSPLAVNVGANLPTSALPWTRGEQDDFCFVVAWADELGVIIRPTKMAASTPAKKRKLIFLRANEKRIDGHGGKQQRQIEVRNSK